MSEDEILEISQTMANLGKVSAGVVEKIFLEFRTDKKRKNSNK
jgi:flagellar motor switch protein FliG